MLTITGFIEYPRLIISNAKVVQQPMLQAVQLLRQLGWEAIAETLKVCSCLLNLSQVGLCIDRQELLHHLIVHQMFNSTQIKRLGLWHKSNRCRGV